MVYQNSVRGNYILTKLSVYFTYTSDFAVNIPAKYDNIYDTTKCA